MSGNTRLHVCFFETSLKISIQCGCLHINWPGSSLYRIEHLATFHKYRISLIYFIKLVLWFIDFKLYNTKWKWNYWRFRPRFCTVRLNCAGDNLGEWDEFCCESWPRRRIDRSTCWPAVQRATTVPQMPPDTIQLIGTAESYSTPNSNYVTQM